MPVERAAGGTSLIDVLDRVLDKGIVIDAWVRVSLVGIDLITVEARVVVASIETYLKYSEAVGQITPVSKPAALEGFLGRTEVSDCAKYALQWLAETAGVTASICVVRPVGEQVMATVATQGLPIESASTFSISLDDWSNPLIASLNLHHTFYPAA